MLTISSQLRSPLVKLDAPAMLHVPLGRRWSGWIEPGTSAVNVEFQFRRCVAVEPSGYVKSVSKFCSLCDKASGDAITVRIPFCLTENVAPVATRVTLRVKSPNFHSIARSESVGVGSTMSIVPLKATATVAPVKVQPVKSKRTESGTRSWSLFAGGMGLTVGHGEESAGVASPAPAISAPNGAAVGSKVRLDDRRSMSFVRPCAISFAWTCVSTGAGCVGCMDLSHATATSPRNATAAKVRVVERVFTNPSSSE